MTGADLDRLRQRSDLLVAELPRTTRAHLALYSGRGEGDDAVEAAVARGEVRPFGPDELA